MDPSKKQPPQSHIPIKSLRTGGFPLHSNHFGLVPPSRHLSVSDTPQKSSPTSSTSASSSTGGGLSSLRSLRNLLPFGSSSKHHQHSNHLALSGPSPPSAHTSRPAFATISALRKSIHGERSVSAPQLRPGKSLEEFPVLTIELSHHLNEPLISQEDLQTGLGLYTSTSDTEDDQNQPRSAPPSAQSFQSPLAPPEPSAASSSHTTSSLHYPTPLAPLPQSTHGLSDLSTILESETSGLSKHIPGFEDSRDISRSLANDALHHHQQHHPRHRSPSPHKPDHSFLASSHDKHHPDRSPSLQDTSALDLSTSKVTSEVLAALAGSKARPEGWLHGIVLDDQESAHSIPTPSSPELAKLEESDNPHVPADTSFEILGPLDPDLAALLSPNRMNPIIIAEPTPSLSSPRPSTNGSFLVAMDTYPHPEMMLSPHPLTPPLTESRRGSPLPSPGSTGRTLALHSSPMRRSTSLSRSSASPAPGQGKLGVSPSSNSSSTATISRLARSASDRPSVHISSQGTLTPSSSSTRTTSSLDIARDRPSTFSNLTTTPLMRRKGVLSPPDGQLPRRPSTGDTETRKPPASRFVGATAATPLRPSATSASPPASASRPLRINGSAANGNSYSPSAWENESVGSPSLGSSRAPSSVGTASGRVYYGRPSLDGGRRGGGQGHHQMFSGGSRDRSASVSENSNFVNGFRSSSTLNSSSANTNANAQVNAQANGGGGGGGGGRPPVTEWLGPRTAKAFAAAGLIDFDKESGGGGGGGGSRPGSRFSSARSQSQMSNGDRELSRSPYAPSSRMTFSEAGSVASSWGRRRSDSISRVGGGNGLGGGGGGGGGGLEGGGGLGERTLTESTSTPRTTFSVSGASTAPTSVSGVTSSSVGQSVQQHLQNEIQTLQERHALETGALLNALADSQRTTKVLRDENGGLRERLAEVEGRLGEALEEIKRLQHQHQQQQQQQQVPLPAASSYMRPIYSRHSSPFSRPTSRGSLDGVGTGGGTWKRAVMSSGLTNVVPPEVDIRVDHEVSDHLQPHPHQAHHHNHTYNTYVPQPHTSGSAAAPSSSTESRRGSVSSATPSSIHHARRYSNSSSIFPVPPSTMTMLLHEDGMSSDGVFSTNSSWRNVGPVPSPTLIVDTKLPGTRLSEGSLSEGSSTGFGGVNGVGGGHHRTSSLNGGNISPTTANFSMVTGSPGSLHLRPEHERLLGDMPTLDLCAEDYEDGLLEDEGG